MFSVVVNGVIINDDGKALIARRASKDDHEPGMWTTPGGTLEVEGEAHNVIEGTLHRELAEEVGVVVHADIELIANNTFVKNSGKQVLALVFLCRYKSGTPMPLDEIDEVAWVERDELDNYDFPPNVKEYVQKGFAAYASQR